MLDGQVAPHTHEVVLKQMESRVDAGFAGDADAFAKGRPGKRGDLFVAAPHGAPVRSRRWPRRCCWGRRIFNGDSDDG